MQALSISEPARSTVLHQLIQQLHHDFDEGSASLCVSLLSTEKTSDQTTAFVDLLVRQIDHDDRGAVVSVSRKAPWIRNLVLSRIVLNLNDPTLHLTGHAAADDVTDSQPTSTIASHLKLVCQLIEADCDDSTLTDILDISLRLLQQADRSVFEPAKELSFAVLNLVSISETTLQPLATCLSALLDSKSDSHHRSIGYGLWLRLLLKSSTKATLDAVQREQYWSSIEHGFLHGDNEQRKLCMEILRQSVAIAVSGAHTQMVSPVDDASPDAIISQYTRFLTVFETIALSRYGNLVAETERTLQLLLSTKSVIDLRWPFLALEVALQPEIQNQVRKSIGRWILTGNMSTTYNSKQFHDFFSGSLLPWMLEGHLFTNSLILASDSTHHCSHGTQASNFIRQLFTAQRTSSSYTCLGDAIVSTFINNRSGLFLYAVVYVFNGWVMATRQAELPPLAKTQIEQLLAVSDWRNMPDAVKKSVTYCCWKLIRTQDADTVAELARSKNDTVRSRWVHLEKMFGQASAQTDPASTPVSQRDIKIREAKAKCAQLATNRSETSHVDLITQLEDLWSEADYLEYPRELMLVLPSAFFSEAVASRLLDEQPEREALVDATQAGSQGTEQQMALQRLLNDTMARFLQLAATRSYLLTPVVSSIRRAIVHNFAIIDLLDLPALVLAIARSPPSPKTDLKFEYATYTLLHGLDSTLHKLMPSETLGYAALFDLVNRLHGRQDIILDLTQGLLRPWMQQKPPMPTISSFKTSLQLQLLVLCCEQIQAQTDRTTTGSLIRDLLWLLSIEPLPRYRYLLSWALNGLLGRFPEHHDLLLSALATQDHHSNPKFVAGMMRLSVELIASSAITEDFANRLAHSFVALSASAKIVIRHEAQWSFPILMDHARRRQWVALSENAAHQALEGYIRSLPRFNDPPLERKLSHFDKANQNTLANLVEGLWTEIDYTRPPYTRQVELARIADETKSGRDADIPFPYLPIGEAIEQTDFSHGRDAKVVDEPSIIGTEVMKQDEAIALQTKGSAYLRMLLEGDRSTKSRTHNLIVVASLLDNPYNLGGLSRVSEIFGAQALYVRDPRIIAEKDFISVAVSSFNHIDIMPLATDGIPGFLAAKRKDGWTVVGVEQTDRSVILGQDASIPEKSILIIGNEKFGMPGHVLSECDLLVEIPQVGITRSMNVQTVAAVVLYEYNRQHSQSGGDMLSA